MEEYKIDYINDRLFLKTERKLKNVNMLAYTKLKHDFYPSLREGKFVGELVSKNNAKGTKTYELKLPCDKDFAKEYGDIKLLYIVFLEEKIVMLDTILPKEVFDKELDEIRNMYHRVQISNEGTIDNDEKIISYRDDGYDEVYNKLAVACIIGFIIFILLIVLCFI